MQTHLVFDADEFEKLDTSADEALAAAMTLGAETQVEATINVCDIVQKVLPILKVAKNVICAIPFGPLKKICKALKTVIDLLEGVCPA